MPKLWDETIEGHRRAVHEAIIETTAELVAERGLASVSMSEIAGRTGIARATLYRYYPDVEAILHAWHERQVSDHLALLTAVRHKETHPADRLAAVLEAYANIQRERAHHRDTDAHGPELAAGLHMHEHLAPAWKQLHEMLQSLIAEAADAGAVRKDVAAGELADYCLHALSAANGAHSQAAVSRLVSITLDGISPSPHRPHD